MGFSADEVLKLAVETDLSQSLAQIQTMKGEVGQLQTVWEKYQAKIVAAEQEKNAAILAEAERAKNRLYSVEEIWQSKYDSLKQAETAKAVALENEKNAEILSKQEKLNAQLATFDQRIAGEREAIRRSSHAKLAADIASFEQGEITREKETAANLIAVEKNLARERLLLAETQAKEAVLRSNPLMNLAMNAGYNGQNSYAQSAGAQALMQTAFTAPLATMQAFAAESNKAGIAWQLIKSNVGFVAASRFGAFMILSATIGGIVAGIYKAVEASAELEKSAQHVRSAMVFDKTDMLSTPVIMDEIAVHAAKMGQSFSDVSTMWWELKSAGLSTAESLRELDVAQKLVVIGAGDVEQTTRTLATVTRLYGQEVGGVEVIGNRLAVYMNKSQVDMNGLMQGMKYASGNASMLGMSFDQVASSISVMNDRALQGAKAGTSLSNELMQMARSSAELNKIFGTNLDPKKGLGEQYDQFLEELHKKYGTVKMDLETFTSLHKEFNERGTRGIAAMVKGYDDYIQRMKDAKENTEALDQMTAEKMNTLTAQWERLKKTFDAFAASEASGVLGFKGLLRGINDIGEAWLKANLSAQVYYEQQMKNNDLKASGVVPNIGVGEVIKGDIAVAAMSLLPAAAAGELFNATLKDLWSVIHLDWKSGADAWSEAWVNIKTESKGVGDFIKGMFGFPVDGPDLKGVEKINAAVGKLQETTKLTALSINDIALALRNTPEERLKALQGDSIETMERRLKIYREMSDSAKNQLGTDKAKELLDKAIQAKEAYDHADAKSQEQLKTAMESAESAFDSYKKGAAKAFNDAEDSIARLKQQMVDKNADNALDKYKDTAKEIGLEEGKNLETLISKNGQLSLNLASMQAFLEASVKQGISDAERKKIESEITAEKEKQKKLNEQIFNQTWGVKLKEDFKEYETALGIVNKAWDESIKKADTLVAKSREVVDQLRGFQKEMDQQRNDMYKTPDNKDVYGQAKDVYSNLYDQYFFGKDEKGAALSPEKKQELAAKATKDMEDIFKSALERAKSAGDTTEIAILFRDIYDKYLGKGGDIYKLDLRDETGAEAASQKAVQRVKDEAEQLRDVWADYAKQALDIAKKEGDDVFNQVKYTLDKEAEAIKLKLAEIAQLKADMPTWKSTDFPYAPSDYTNGLDSTGGRSAAGPYNPAATDYGVIDRQRSDWLMGGQGQRSSAPINVTVSPSFSVENSITLDGNAIADQTATTIAQRTAKGITSTGGHSEAVPGYGMGDDFWNKPLNDYSF